MEDQGPPSSQALFRATKRRKVYRQRRDEDDETDPTLLDNQAQSIRTASIEKNDQLSAHDREQDNGSEMSGTIHRPRKATGTRKAGIGFAIQPNVPRQSSEAEENTALVRADVKQDMLDKAASRFTAPTGQAIQRDDKHMMAYIDARMSNVRSLAADHEPQSLPCDSPASTTREPLSSTTAPSRAASSKAAFTGDIEEVTLPHTSASKDNSNTKKASRPPRIRLGRNGKPLPPRPPRNRRTPNDLARDALVERLMSESRLENIYTDPSPSPGPSASATGTKGAEGQGAVKPGQDEDADERMAAEFAREFLANAEESRERKSAAPGGGGGRAVGADGKGPKMGGSRSARAAIAAKEAGAGREKGK